MGKELLSEKRSSWEGSFLVGRELPSGKAASKWKGSFQVGKQRSSGKGAS